MKKKTVKNKKETFDLSKLKKGKTYSVATQDSHGDEYDYQFDRRVETEDGIMYEFTKYSIGESYTIRVYACEFYSINGADINDDE